MLISHFFFFVFLFFDIIKKLCFDYNTTIILWGGIRLHHFFGDTGYTLHFQNFQSPNSRSKPFNLLDMLKCACRSNFTFFGICLLFIKYLTKSLYSDRWIFVPILINSKKIQKNVKFDLHAHFNISIMLNGSDFINIGCNPVSPKMGVIGSNLIFNRRVDNFKSLYG